MGYAIEDNFGEVPEWFNGAVLKTVGQKCSVGSNPTLSSGRLTELVMYLIANQRSSYKMRRFESSTFRKTCVVYVSKDTIEETIHKLHITVAELQ